jgi:hypothetical protein
VAFAHSIDASLTCHTTLQLHPRAEKVRQAKTRNSVIQAENDIMHGRNENPLYVRSRSKSNAEVVKREDDDEKVAQTQEQEL